MEGRNERRAGFVYVTEEAGAQGEGEGEGEACGIQASVLCMC